MGLGLLWFQAASIRLKSNMLGVKLGAWSQHLLGGRCLVLEFETKKDLKCLLEVTWFRRKARLYLLIWHQCHVGDEVGQGFKDLYFSYFSKHTGTESRRVQNDRDKAISLPTWFQEISSCRIV
jgi:hypothetical protein